MGNKTPLYQCHLDAGAKLVDFAGWEMPINYGSQITEHEIVRSDAGMFTLAIGIKIVDIFIIFKIIVRQEFICIGMKYPTGIEGL